MAAYTDVDWCSAADAYWEAAGVRPRSGVISAVLNAVAPAIAARALREAADRYGAWERPDSGLIPKEWADGFMQALDGAAKDLRDRADEIEGSP